MSDLIMKSYEDSIERDLLDNGKVSELEGVSKEAEFQEFLEERLEESKKSPEFTKEEITQHFLDTYDCKQVDFPLSPANLEKFPIFTILPRGTDCVIPPKNSVQISVGQRLRKHLNKVRRSEILSDSEDE